MPWPLAEQAAMTTPATPVSMVAAAFSVPGRAELPVSPTTAKSGAVSELGTMSLPATVALSNTSACMVTFQPTAVPRGSLIEKPLKSVPPPATFAFSVKP